MFISVTRLRIRKHRYLLPFFLQNERVVKQTVRAPGFLQGQRSWTPAAPSGR